VPSRNPWGTDGLRAVAANSTQVITATQSAIFVPRCFTRSRDDYSYQFSLAEALVGLNRSSEAQAYLINLWERQPHSLGTKVRDHFLKFVFTTNRSRIKTEYEQVGSDKAKTSHRLS